MQPSNNVFVSEHILRIGSHSQQAVGDSEGSAGGPRRLYRFGIGPSIAGARISDTVTYNNIPSYQRDKPTISLPGHSKHDLGPEVSPEFTWMFHPRSCAELVGHPLFGELHAHAFKTPSTYRTKTCRASTAPPSRTTSTQPTLQEPDILFDIFPQCLMSTNALESYLGHEAHAGCTGFHFIKLAWVPGGQLAC